MNLDSRPSSGGSIHKSLIRGDNQMQDFRDLKVWEKAHYLTLGVYKASATFPKDELYGLTSQIRRSSASVPTNPVK